MTTNIARIKVVARSSLMGLFFLIKKSPRIVGEKLGNPDFWAKILMGFAVLSAFAAIVFASLWFTTSWYTPYENYREIEEVITKDGQYLRIEYPKYVLANNKSANLLLTLNGKIDTDSSVSFIFPNEVRVFGNQDKAALMKLTRKFSKSDSNPRSIKVSFVNSKTIEEGWWWYSNKTIEISSSDLSFDTVYLPLQMETVGWAAIREFVHSSVGDKSPLILLASGLISWAGTYLLQYIKEKREQQKEKEQEKREKSELAKKNNEDLWSGLKSNPVLTVKNFADQIKEDVSVKGRDAVFEEFQNAFRVLELNDWQNLIVSQIIVYWSKGNTSATLKLIEILKTLEIFFDNTAQKSAELLLQVDTLVAKEKISLQIAEANAILNTYKDWGNSIKQTLQMIVLKCLQYPENLTVLAASFKEKKNLSYPLLRDSEIVALLRQYNTQQLSSDQSNALADLNWILLSGVHWRNLWQTIKRRPSQKIYNWLKQNDVDVKRIPFGSEFAELDVDLDYYKVEHEVVARVGYPVSSIVFGEKGSGKTATAYILTKSCQMAILGGKPESGAFPVYCRFDDFVDTKVWLLDCISRALIAFVSDNPDRFLLADGTRRLAMGKLMLTQFSASELMHGVLKRSYAGVSDEREDVYKELSEMSRLASVRKDIDDTYLIDFLQMSMPDGFDRTYIIVDISSRCPLQQIVTLVTDLSKLSLQLAKYDIFFKIFTPIDSRASLNDISMFEKLELSWDDRQLRALLQRRFERLIAFCDQKVKIKKPDESLIKASRKSPRKLIHYGNSLMQYAEKNLSESAKLPLEAFSEIFSAGSKKS